MVEDKNNMGKHMLPMKYMQRNENYIPSLQNHVNKEEKYKRKKKRKYITSPKE